MKPKHLATKLSFAIFITMAIGIIIAAVLLAFVVSYQAEKIILQKVSAATQIGSACMEASLTEIADNGIYSLNEIFDFTLTKITLPKAIQRGYSEHHTPQELLTIQKYHYQTGLDSYLDNMILELEDQFLKDTEILYAVLVDKNGYVPAHNSKYNLMLTGDYKKDLLYNRTKRIYTDPVAKKISENTNRKKVLKQVYKRDTGELIWDISYPVFVKGRYWGAFRMGVSLTQLTEFLLLISLLLIGFMLLLFGILVFLVYRITKRMLKPLVDLQQGVTQISSGNLSYQIPVQSEDEIGDVVLAFNQMTADLRQHIDQLTTTTAAKERMESELKIAHNIQMSIIPKLFPAYPERPEFDVRAILEPAREVGGDLYDFFFIDDDHFCFVIGDVSDKGVPASLLMAVTKTLIKRCAKENSNPEIILNIVNNEIAESNDSCMFVTLFLGILNVKTGEIHFANAGHNPPVILQQDKPAKILELQHSLPLGVAENYSYPYGVIKLNPGDVIFLYTDGVTEAFNKNKDLFSMEKLVQTLEVLRTVFLKKMVFGVLDSVKEFAKDTPQSDDITILALKYFQVEERRDEPLKETKTITITNKIEEIAHLAQSVEAFGKINQFSAKVISTLNLALEEMVSNIILYGFQDKKSHPIQIRLSYKGEQIIIEIKDDGIPFNPLDIPEPNTDQSLEERPIGGLGIHLVRKMMDHMEYRRELGKNRLVLKINITKATFLD